MVVVCCECCFRVCSGIEIQAYKNLHKNCPWSTRGHRRRTPNQFVVSVNQTKDSSCFIEQETLPSLLSTVSLNQTKDSSCFIEIETLPSLLSTVSLNQTKDSSCFIEQESLPSLLRHTVTFIIKLLKKI